MKERIRRNFEGENSSTLESSQHVPSRLYIVHDLAIESMLRNTDPYFKIGLLLLSLCLLTVLLIDRYRQRRNTPYEIAGSIVCGIVIQCLVNVFYEAKKIQVL